MRNRGRDVTRSEIDAARRELVREEANLRALDPNGFLSRRDHIALVHAWAALARALRQEERKAG